MQNTTLQELATAINGRIVQGGDGNVTFDTVVTDSRQVRSGDVFWALRGDVHDGHRFVQQAVDAGAVASVVAEDECDRTHGQRVVARKRTALPGVSRGDRAGERARNTRTRTRAGRGRVFRYQTSWFDSVKNNDLRARDVMDDEACRVHRMIMG